MRPVFHNAELETLSRKGGYQVAQVEAIAEVFHDHGVLDVTPLATGLFPASSASGIGASGYGNVWVRDNVYVALARLESGRPADAAAVALALLSFYGKHRHRLTVPAKASGPRDIMSRPHVRFDGNTLEELQGERWPHAQNDALGYCLWLCARLVRRRVIEPDPASLGVMALLSGYFATLRYWEDEDSGHWEETRKQGASSIGVVVAGLEEWLALLHELAALDVVGLSRASLIDAAATSVQHGRDALAGILPAECVQPSPLQNRRYDAALLFLLCPLAVVDGAMADRIASDIGQHLQGEVGIRRYPGDSYWAPDYESRLPAADLTRDYSEDLGIRDRLLERAGDEAQWCIFDPMLSVFHGQRFLATGGLADLEAQALYFNRSLAQVTSQWHCPELYYKRNGEFVPNPHVPLLWTQANLQLALTTLRATARRRA